MARRCRDGAVLLVGPDAERDDPRVLGRRGTGAPRGDLLRGPHAARRATTAPPAAREGAAEALKQERLAAARANRSTGPEGDGATAPGVGPGEARTHTTTTGGTKRDASSQAQGARRQAARDGR